MRLRPSSSIGIVALSLPTVGPRVERVRSAVSALERLGFRPVLGSSVFQQQSYRSSDIPTRVKDLMGFFSDPSIDCILSTTGGFNSNELLEYMDYSIVRNNPKWFVGYSDLTAVNLALYTKAGLSTVNGPMLVDYADDPSVFDRLFPLLAASSMEFSVPERVWEWEKKNERPNGALRCVPGKSLVADGPVIAGNLSTFALLLGTQYLPDCSKSILFLEYDQCETDGLASLQRMLWQLRQNGLFAKISGLVFGALPFETAKEEKKEWGIADILREVTEGFDFPVVFDAPFGHMYPSWILINGMNVRINASAEISIVAV